MSRWGLAEGRVHGQRQLAAPDLRPRGAPHDRPVRDDRERTAEAATDARVGRHGLLHDGFAQRAALRHARGLRAERRRHRRRHQRPYQIAYGSLVPKTEQCDEPAGAGVRLELAHRLRFDPHGAGVHDPRASRAATAAVLAIDDGIAVQDVPYAALRKRLLQDGQVLEAAASKSAAVGIVAGG